MKFLIVGLGNIGPEYEHTRHNIGFDVLDAWAKKHEATFELGRHAYHCTISYKGRKAILIKPTTYMNLSGKAVKHWMSVEKIPLDRVLVITDDLALPLGKIRMRGKGSAGGHNGLKDIIVQLGTDQYSRIKFGIGDNFRPGRQVEYVLGKWNAEEEIDCNLAIDKSIEMIESFITQGLERTMNQFN
ncbi:aminoacyl-tRNA hydrolase [bacterium]|nr:aminoacyl-tRNA hydrolase [bacterium]